MDKILTETVIETQRLAGECLKAIRELPKVKENQESEDRMLLIWRDLRKLAESIQEQRASMQ